MSKKELEYNLYLLENLRKYGQEALIEADKLEYLNSDNKWENFSNLDLSYVPALIYAEKISDKNMSNLIYELSYKLLIPKIEVVPTRTERIIICQNEDETYTKKYISSKNEDSEFASIRYNNKGINTFSKVKDEEVVMSFIMRNKHKLYKAAKIVNDSIMYNEVKKLIK